MADWSACLCPAAVRFGRIPKREKQRMLLEMQSAMNNMMNNSQTLAVDGPPLPTGAMEATSEEGGGPAPSSSPSSQSDSSSEPEPSVAMDTSPSSASPSTSDSGEEEVIGSVTRAHQETFMYTQEQGAPVAQAQNPAGSQDAWNHCNNLVSMSATEPPAGHRVNATNHCPFRTARASTPSHCPAYAHKGLRAAGAVHAGPNREGNRMYLVRASESLCSSVWFCLRLFKS